MQELVRSIDLLRVIWPRELDRVSKSAAVRLITSGQEKIREGKLIDNRVLVRKDTHHCSLRCSFKLANLCNLVQKWSRHLIHPLHRGRAVDGVIVI